MSDAVKTPDIEDVLSSIRRLVAEEGWTPGKRPNPPVAADSGRLVLTPSLRVAQSDADSPVTGADQGTDPDRLPGKSNRGHGLTSRDGADADEASELADEIRFRLSRRMFRADPKPSRAQESSGVKPVSEANIDASPETDTPAPLTQHLADNLADDPEAIQDSAWELEESSLTPDNRAPVTADDGEGAPSVQDKDQVADPANTPDAPNAKGAEDGKDGTEDGGRERPWRIPDMTLQEAAADPVDDPDTDLENEEHSEAQASTALSDAESVDKADPEPTSEISATAPVSDEPAALAETTEQATEDVTAAPAPAGPVEEPVQPTSLDQPSEGSKTAQLQNRADSLGAKIKALEAAIAHRQDQWEPDGNAGDDYAGTPIRTIPWQDHDPVEPSDTPADDSTAPDAAIAEPSVAEEDSRAGAADVLSENEAVLDEAALRDLVADIVRQELQGALGERITRNVRKLVRREIHRAITAREL